MRFGTDGIRGQWPQEPLTPAVATALGAAVAATFGPRVGIARDTRESGGVIEHHVAAGQGVEHHSCGVLPTAAASTLVAAGVVDAAVVITASHNPWQDNGLKVIGPGGRKLDATAEQALAERLEKHLADPPRASPSTWSIEPRARRIYLDALAAALPSGQWLRGARIAVDCAHGAATWTAPQILEGLGAEVVPLGVAPDGRNINRARGALHPEALARQVRHAHCDAGIALDGDADRCVLVTGSGRVVDGDALLLLLARGPGVVGTVMCNQALAIALADRGMDLVRTGVGDRQVAQELARLGWQVGGEPSGHVLFSDGLPTGDGMLTGLRALAGGVDLDARLAGWQPHAQARAAVVVAHRPPLRSLGPLQDALAALEGRAVVRYSGTEPKLRLQVEGTTADDADRELQLLLDAVAASGLRETPG